MLRFITRLLVRPYRRKRPPSRDVAIVVPLSNRSDLTPDEEISMRHLVHFLGRHDKFLVAPKGLRVHFDGFQVKRFSTRYFGSVAAHTLLLYSPMFYKAFEDYKFIFFYHLDSLAFSDQLDEWCATNIDYIGPPWIECPESPWVKKSRVGNGGFTLLRVESALKVLHSRYHQETGKYWLDVFTRNSPRSAGPLLEKLQRRFPRSKIVNRFHNAWQEMTDPTLYGKSIDIFWSDRAVKYMPEFKVASLEDGLRFGFEVAPRLCFEMNHQKMPFGCHAWARYDRSFWEPHLLKA